MHTTRELNLSAGAPPAPRASFTDAFLDYVHFVTVGVILAGAGAVVGLCFVVPS